MLPNISLEWSPHPWRCLGDGWTWSLGIWLSRGLSRSGWVLSIVLSMEYGVLCPVLVQEGHRTTTTTTTVVGVVSLMVGIANSFFSSREGCWNWPCYFLYKHFMRNLSKQAGTIASPDSLLSKISLVGEKDPHQRKKGAEGGWSNLLFPSTVLVWLPNWGRGGGHPGRSTICSLCRAVLQLPGDKRLWACQMELHTLRWRPSGHMPGLTP